jgi:hypothetical protein
MGEDIKLHINNLKESQLNDLNKQLDNINNMIIQNNSKSEYNSTQIT